MRSGIQTGVRRLVLPAGPVELSALLSEPEAAPPRAVVVALHGGGVTAEYFNGQAHPDVSLLALGPRLGFTVLAVDRPGYGHSAGRLPGGVPVADQALLIRAALGAFAREYAAGEGMLLLAHSFGGMVALTMAAMDGGAGEGGSGLLGIDVSGCGSHFAVGSAELAAVGTPRRKHHWGPLGLYPPGTFRASAAMVAPMPARERSEVARWPGFFPAVGAGVRVPVRFTFAEHESWWRHDDAALTALAGSLAATRVVVDRQRGAGHNISLGWAARAYHLRALAFAEDCLPDATATSAA